MAILSTAVAYLLYFAILARAGAANLMLVTLLIPPFAIGLGVVFLGERLGLEAWLGFGLIALGLAITDGRLLAGARRLMREAGPDPASPGSRLWVFARGMCIIPFPIPFSPAKAFCHET